MSRLRSRGPLLTKNRTSGSRPPVDVDPVLAVLLGVVVVAGGGLAAYGASQDTDPAPAPARVVQEADPVVARALAIVERVDGTAAAGETGPASSGRRASLRARRASERGRSTDPFAAVRTATAAVDRASTSATTGAAVRATTGTATASGVSVSAVELARRAAAGSATANATTQAATAGSSGSTATVLRPTGSSGGESGTASTEARARRLAASQPAKISLRVATPAGRATRSRRSMGLLVPNATQSVARVIDVSRSNEVVTLRLRTGAALTGKQSRGTTCVQRTDSGACRLVRVRTGRTAVIRAPRTHADRPGTITAIRVLAVWRGGFKLAD